MPKYVTVFAPLMYLSAVRLVVLYTSMPQLSSEASARPGWRQGSPVILPQVSQSPQPPPER